MKLKKDWFSLYLTSQLGLLTGLSLHAAVNAPLSDELARQEFFNLPTYEARSYVPYENSGKEYQAEDLSIVFYKDNFYLVDQNLVLIGSDNVSFFIVDSEEERNHDKQVFATDMISYSDIVPVSCAQESFTVIEAYDYLDWNYEALKSRFEYQEEPLEDSMVRRRYFG